MDNKKDTLQALYNRRSYLQKKLKNLCPFLRGSIVEYRVPVANQPVGAREDIYIPLLTCP